MDSVQTQIDVVIDDEAIEDIEWRHHRWVASSKTREDLKTWVRSAFPSPCAPFPASIEPGRRA
jgi:hypothetical protein